MPNRVLRDELLTSERWWAVSAEAGRLWLSIVLSADDLGRCPGNPFTCRTKYLAGTIANPERVEKLVAELHDVDLIRVYEHDGARYFFVPRYRQFVRYTRSRYPEPPHGISDITSEKQCPSTTQATPKRPEVKRSEVKRSESTPLASSDTDSAGVSVPLAGNREWPVPSLFLRELEAAYPAVDGTTTLREIRAWCISNPDRRKTERGVRRFINRWFEKEQNRG